MKRMRVLTASVDHETHSFSILQTKLRDFKTTEWLCGEEIPKHYLGTQTGWGGVIESGAELGWDIHYTVATCAEPSGIVDDEALNAIIDRIIIGCRSEGPFDGVLLMLHGAMSAESYPDAEGEILERVRKAVGKNIPISVSLDLHANVTNRMIDFADILTSYRTTPHIDQYETAVRAANLLHNMMTGVSRPVLYLCRGSQLTGLDLGRTLTQNGPMPRALNLARQLEQENEAIIDISLNAGYPYGDIEEAGPSVVIVSNSNGSTTHEVAERLQKEVWDTRAETTLKFTSFPDAIVKMVSASGNKDRARPLIVADYTDGTGGGGYGDGTMLLSSMLEAQLKHAVFGSIFDPEVVAIAYKAGEGSEIDILLGAKIDSRFGGEPISTRAKVICLSDGKYVRKGPYCHGTIGNLGLSVRLDIEGIAVVVCSKRIQTEDREQFRIFGIHPEKARVLCCKGINHFRADFEPIASEICFVDSGGLVSEQLHQFPFRHLRRPIWPLDLDAADETSFYPTQNQPVCDVQN